MPEVSSVNNLSQQLIDDALKNFSSDAQKLVPSDKQASWFAYGGSVVRFSLTFLAGKGVGWASGVTGDEQTMITWLVVAGAMLLWSLAQKKVAAIRTWWATRASAAVSAHATQLAGIPVAVPVEPPPNKV